MLSTMDPSWTLIYTVVAIGVVGIVRRRASSSLATAITEAGGIDDDCCAICLSQPINPKQLGCGHAFCTDCIDQVRQRAHQGLNSNVCPLCRAPLSAETAFMDAIMVIIRWERHGGAALDAEELSQAVRSLEWALELDENHIGALITLGEMLSDLEPDRAIPMLRKAIDQSEDPQPTALLALGTALLTLGDIQDAMNEYQKAITTGKQQQNNSVVASAHMQLAIVYEERGQLDLAVQEYEKAMVADPDNHLVPFNLGVALEATDNEGAIRAYRKSLLMDMDFYETNMALANAYQRQIIENARDNSLAAGLERAEGVQLWLGAALRAKVRATSPPDVQDIDEHIQKIEQYFPNAWAVYREKGDSYMMARV
jgi:tetratricopeptide (TPR) repeat protein